MGEVDKGAGQRKRRSIATELHGITQNQNAQAEEEAFLPRINTELHGKEQEKVFQSRMR